MAILDMRNEDVLSKFVPSWLHDDYRNGSPIIEQYHLCSECAYLLSDLQPQKFEKSYSNISPKLFCKNCTCELGSYDDIEFTNL